MNADGAVYEPYLISPCFRDAIEKRIARLERDAAQDESWIEHLENDDHIRRHRRLVAIERAEALRMRLFLDRTEARPVRSSASPLNLES